MPWPLLFIALCCILTGCGDASAAKPVLRVGVIEWTGFYPLIQAQAQGSFDRAGLATTVVAYPDNPALNAALLTGEVDVAGMVWTDVLRLGGQGHGLRAIAVTDWSDHGDVILAAPGIQEPAMLRGKRIACEGIHTFSHLFVLNFLAKHRLPEVEVELVNMPAQAIPAALKSGAIDAGHTWGPLAEAASASGCRILDRAGLVPGSMTQVLAAKATTIDLRHDDLIRLIRCFYAAQPLSAEQADACRLAAGTFFAKHPANLSPIGREAHLVGREEALRLMRRHEDAQSLYVSGQTIIKQLARRGQVPADLDPAQFISNACIEP